MNEIDTKFRTKISWDSDEDDILNDFYKPVLKSAKKYQRLAGYFSSTSFIIAMQEIIHFIKKGGNIELVTSAHLSKYDTNMLEKIINGDIDIMSESFFQEIKMDEDIPSKCCSILGYLLNNKVDGIPQLKIKIAIPLNNKILYHHKIGILTLDTNEIISFAGSVNETGNAWKGNIENFSVFRSWGDETCKTMTNDLQKQFNKYWNDGATGVKIFDLPEAIKNKLIKQSPQSTNEFEELVESLKHDFEQKRLKFITNDLRDYQKNAIKSWMDNDGKGLLEMATGTGKTFTALGCMHKIQQKEKRLVTIIAIPYKHLLHQWRDSMTKWNMSMPTEYNIGENVRVIAHSDNSRWNRELQLQIQGFDQKLYSGKHKINFLTIYVTHDTLSTTTFSNIIKNLSGKTLLIVDEVHGIGSNKRKQCLSESYEYRLGLSATPTRHYDEDGSKIILEYFHNVVFQFTLKSAINRGYLVHYDYHPIYIELTDEEITDYFALTRKIAREIAVNSNDRYKISDSKFYSSNERSKLISNAVKKYDVLETFLKTHKLSNALIYCHENQLIKVSQILKKFHVVNGSITHNDETENRWRKLEGLKNKDYDCITAIKCLDEGVDIPWVDTIIILASSGNPMQYIQRRGRVLRRSEGKTKAIIYDIIVKPPQNDASFSDVEKKISKKLVAKELLRHKEFADIAHNKSEAMDVINTTARKYGIELVQLSAEYIKNIE